MTDRAGRQVAGMGGTLIARALPLLALWKTAARAAPMPHWQSKTPGV